MIAAAEIAIVIAVYAWLTFGMRRFLDHLDRKDGRIK